MSSEKSKFIVSARKYRPTAWGEVVGQEAITSTLANAIEQEQLAHAYLFCGPRGVGKTTCARIFAKEINLDDQHGEDEDFAFNIFELDAASNNKVEDIRNLIDQVRIPPQIGRYKVYIIDEVHMLSTQAFNAFLKTLEEPPAHAIFILATTEKHKIIPTILSRCQIYDFNRIGVEEIAEHLRGIATKENITFEEEALHIIGQKADGALRDALSIFDQLSSFTHRQLTYEAVVKNLHVLDYDYHFKMVDHLFSGNYQEALLLLDEILKLGFDGSHFLSGLASHMRDLLVAKDERTIRLLEVGDNVKGQYGEQAAKVDTPWIAQSLKATSKTEAQYRNSSNQRLLLEIMLLSISTLQQEKKNSNSELEEQVKPAVAAKKLEAPRPEPASTPTPLKAEEKPTPQPATPTPVPEQTAEVAETPKVPSAPSAPTNEPAESGKPATKRRRSSSMTTSISDSGVEEEKPSESEMAQEPEANYDLPESENTVALSFADAWKALCDEALEQGKSSLYAILVRQKTDEQINGKELAIKLLHEVEADEFDSHKTEILGKLRNLCQDKDIGFVNSISKQHVEVKLFGAKEKFQHLAEQNPLLHKLKSELDLDIT